MSFFDGRELEAKVVGRDKHTDVAVLRIDARALPSLPLGDSDAVEVGDDLVALDSALEKLDAQDAEAAQVVKLRFFAGLTGAEAAAALDILPRTADRAWTYARVFLLTELQK